MSTYRFAVLIATIVVLVSTLSVPASAQDRVQERTPYTINAGDRLEISVWKEPDLQRTVLVRPDGAFSFPLAGDVRAEGRTVSDIAEEITKRLEGFIPGLVVTVTVSEIGGNKIFIIGQVNRPGEFVVNPRVDVMQALSIAGGATPFAQLNDIKILRRSGGSQTVLKFRYGDVAKGQNLEQNIILKVGDVVVVP
jgi:polysaccharide export outer membrane protein